MGRDAEERRSGLAPSSTDHEGAVVIGLRRAPIGSSGLRIRGARKQESPHCRRRQPRAEYMPLCSRLPKEMAGTIVGALVDPEGRRR